MSAFDDSSQALVSACARMESAVGSAIVPGELEGWCRSVLKCLHEVGADLRSALDVRSETLADIAGEDPTLLARTEALDRRLEDVRRGVDALEERLSGLCKDSAPIPASSEEPTRTGEKLRRAFLQWIVETRAVDREIGTWYQEAVNRDRGVAD